jgi:aminobenzoyl-glutamate utilization protein B
MSMAVPGHDVAAAWLDEHGSSIAELSDLIWDFAEPGLCETRSAAALTDRLREHGYEIEMGVAGLPTAFVATYGAGAPVVGLMCEYDATPGEAQTPSPYPDPVPGKDAGFTDLHNGIGAASVGAAIAAANAMAAAGLPGTIVVYGTPAEKLCLAKPFMALAGLFDRLDAMVAWHPRFYSTVEWDTGPGPYHAEIVDFFGTSAYGAKPSAGVSALDGITLMNVVVQFLREHLPTQHQISINELVSRGGDHPTSLPNHAQAWYVVRANKLAGIELATGALDRAARSAALALGAEFRRRVVAETRPWLPNHTMAEVCLRNLERAGAPTMSDEAREFGERVLARLGREVDGPIFDETISDPRGGITAEFGGGADDVTEFCWHAPTARIYVAYGLATTGLPNWARAAFARTEAAHRCVLTAARAMAFSVLELLTDPAAVSTAQAEFRQRRADAGALPPLLPADATPPVGADDALPYMREHLLRSLFNV